jgi:transcriptional regulator with XRE-family HTH domain
MPDSDYRDLFARRLRALRDSLDLSIEEASERGGLSATFWGSVERVVQEPCLNSIFGFAKGLGITTGTLMTFDSEPRSEERKELDTFLDFFSTQQLQLVLRISRLIYDYRSDKPIGSSADSRPL